MPDRLTLRGLGAVLYRDLQKIARAAAAEIRDVDAIASAELDEAVELLLDRYVLSLTLAKPVGLATWAERYAAEFGRVGALDVAAAVSRALANAAAAYELDRPNFESFLRTLDADVTHFAAERTTPQTRPEQRSAEVLLAMLAARDPRAIAHARAVAHWARRLCAQMRLDRERTEFVALCALLHDVGMIATPEAILNKPGPLSGVETSIVREHAAAGERILRGIVELSACADIVRSHHERWDGAGYPDRIAGTSIPVEARIVAVSDAFHAMISERPHRLPIAPRAALEIVAAGRGTQWDPGIVDALLALFRHARDAEPARASSA